MAKDKDQPVPAWWREWESKDQICPKGNIQDWHRQQSKFKMTTWPCWTVSVPEERNWLDKVERATHVQVVQYVLFSIMQSSHRQAFTALWSLISIVLHALLSHWQPVHVIYRLGTYDSTQYKCEARSPKPVLSSYMHEMLFIPAIH